MTLLLNFIIISIIMKLSPCDIWYCLPRLLHTGLPKIELSFIHCYMCAANDEPSFQWSKQTTSANDDIRLTAHYLDGDNYTSADEFYWTLPDGSTLAPGNSTDVYRALSGRVRC